jgi:hypothetical protein
MLAFVLRLVRICQHPQLCYALHLPIEILLDADSFSGFEDILLGYDTKTHTAGDYITNKLIMWLEAGNILLQFPIEIPELSCMEEVAGCLGNYEYIKELRKVQLPLYICLHFANIIKECVNELPVDDEERTLVGDLTCLANYMCH